MNHAQKERRDFERIKGSLDVTYRLLSNSDMGVSDESLSGVTEDINPRGILLTGKLPCLSLVVPLLTQKILISLELSLPKPKTTIKALAGVRWVEEVEEVNNTCAMGLYFHDISSEDRQKLFEFLVWQRG